MYDTERINEIEIGNITFWIHICTHCYEKKRQRSCVLLTRERVFGQDLDNVLELFLVSQL